MLFVIMGMLAVITALVAVICLQAARIHELKDQVFWQKAGRK